MDLLLFCVFLALTIILIALGLFRAEHTELSLIGFLFLFLLSFSIIGENIDYKVGTDTNITYHYVEGDAIGKINHTSKISRDVYDTATVGSTNSHRFGYWLAVCSIIGFAGVILGMRRQKF